MPYPEPHIYLTVNWKDTREPDEGGQFGIRFDPVGSTVNQAMVTACATAVSTFWTHADSQIPTPYVLSYLRMAMIGEDGKYVPGTFSRDHSYGAGVAPTPATWTPMPLQVSSVATLLTEFPRGQASRGRLYLPPLTSAVQTTGRWLAADVNRRADRLALMLTTLNGVIKENPGGLPAFAAVYSKGTVKNAAGLRAFVTGVKIGTRPDVQRRRAKSMLEVYGNTSPVTGPA